ncbi:hypothetical protein GWI33_002651 [Rhynchophorus ferrugineus]|uniref:Uncharacterized protein n=1 Tax=Rhynchophorus ferrugineus TaxID=354439 RepID=A0A834MG96_RHYFE|nr:hypothetical protein GWI33_002651 [Rhynchophorus ferrugineus]
MPEKVFTMQSEETEEAVSYSEQSKTQKMTYTKSQSILLPENIVKAADVDTESCPTAKFNHINLEDDIEKVEVESHDSSSSSKGVAPEKKIEFLSIPDFAGIPEENPNESVKNWLQKITEIHNGAVKKSQAAPPQTNASRVVKYQDLPYMGEITLDNSKPRRGRKPKKADICHLIYKNYGTIFPGTPNASSYLEKDSNTPSKKMPVNEKDADVINRSDVQNKIISSLLEKRLTQENKKNVNEPKEDQNEPLNLCIRDLNHLRIRFTGSNDKSANPNDVKSEPQSDDDIEIVTETPSPSLSVRNELRFPSTPDSLSTSSPDTPNTPEGQNGPGGYVYWPNAGVFIHPLALQQQLMMYQRLAGNMNYSLPSHSPRPPPGNGDNKTDPTEQLRKIVPKLTKAHESDSSHHDNKPKRNASSASNSEKTPAKRKRSAIFIPPIPTENSSNPATEVSICKFKFTGGAKPSLQEKKMLSVDSGGNFRYYSGTGDKSMRGYEFFPRETLQQQITSTQGSSTGAFLQASGEKIYPVPPLDITGGNSTSDFLLTPQLPGSSLAAIQHEVANSNTAIRNKKRKSRKSLQREKLEQTFKEKGFLIQTQQLESAEGATYCKFRQLRKFTRYLFRSWKDYLPGNVRELQENEQRELQPSDVVEMPSDSMDSISVKSGDLAGPS